MSLYLILITHFRLSTLFLFNDAKIQHFFERKRILNKKVVSTSLVILGKYSRSNTTTRQRGHIWKMKSAFRGEIRKSFLYRLELIYHIFSLLCVFLFFLQFLEFLFRNVLQQVLLDIVLGRQLEAVFADEEILRETSCDSIPRNSSVTGLCRISRGANCWAFFTASFCSAFLSFDSPIRS